MKQRIIYACDIKSIYEFIENINCINFVSSTLNYSYDTERDCEACNCDDYCRCGMIVNAEVSEPVFIDNPFNMPKEQFELIKGLIDCDDFNFDISGGYYGQEIDGIYLSDITAKILADEKIKLFLPFI